MVDPRPGTTRDRLDGVSEWRGVSFRVADTGGVERFLEDKKRRHQKKRAVTDSTPSTNLTDLHEGRAGGVDPPGAAPDGIHGQRGADSSGVGVGVGVGGVVSPSSVHSDSLGAQAEHVSLASAVEAQVRAVMREAAVILFVVTPPPLTPPYPLPNPRPNLPPNPPPNPP